MEQHNSSTVSDATELFGSFHLADTELALSVSSLQEVVNYPSSVTQVPLAPDFLLGLFNLRGTLVPIIHLGELLKLPDASVREQAKIAIVDIDQAKVGLLFDATGEILRVHGSQKIAFGHEDTGTPMISGALKLDQGDRILQILSPASLTGLSHLPRIQEGGGKHQQRIAQSLRRQCVSFRVSDARLALPMDAIHEIIRVPELQSTVLSSEFCLGTLNLRGHTVPVVDFARFLGLPPRTVEGAHVEDERRIIVIKEQDIHFGLLADEVESIVSYHPEDVLPIPAFTQQGTSFFSGCISGGAQRDIILIARERLFTDGTIHELIRHHRDLYVTSTPDDGGHRRKHARETYVTFRLEHLIGVRIEQLREVIDFSPDIVRPPGAPAYVCGILNLRQALVTIIDLRALYGIAPHVDLADTKVLIIEENGEKYGLVVDAIENIVTIDAADKLPVPRVLLGHTRNTLQHDMKDVVDMGDHRTLMLLDLAPLKARLAGDATTH
ncbi:MULTISPECIES: chemotaxis protein CheW [Dyella]|uniref:Chemotaxis protein CheW n=2 Tax=Dyella TaxID=231454 RepID=A0A4R0YY78_9GAMM|nr:MULTISPECIES: chemotaxis protein CheW [Dyella]TBR40078.1 chemotaxis protein CheW [Dyella terrae]TCI12339.1 chemotaxis protein CheW [Dyella soli]